MSPPYPVYRSLLRLYPREFRQHYGADLVQHYADLVTDRGARAAWTRTGIDLSVTVPRYRLECIMTEQHSATTLNIGIIVLAAGGVMSALTGLYPGLLLLAAAVALAVAQRSTLAKAIRTPDSSRRRRRLYLAAVLTVISAVSYVAFLQWIGETWTKRETLLSVVGIPAMIGAVVFLIIGLLTPKTSENRQGAA